MAESSLDELVKRRNELSDQKQKLITALQAAQSSTGQDTYTNQLNALEKELAMLEKELQAVCTNIDVRGNTSSGSGNQTNIGQIVGNVTIVQHPPNQFVPPAISFDFPKPPQPFQVFLVQSGSRTDGVNHLYQSLQKSGYKVWQKEEDLLPGQDWRLTIQKQVRQSSIVILCLTKDFNNKAGVFQRELKLALDTAEELPENTIFIIPVRLEECEIPQRLSDVTPVDLFAPKGYEILAKSLQSVANKT